MTRRRGFTLVELMLVIALIAVLSGTVFGFALQLLEDRDRLSRANADLQSVGVMLDRMERDLLTCVAGAGGAVGVAGDATSLTIMNRGVWIGEGEAGKARAADLQGTAYRFDANAGVVTMRRWNGDDGAGEDEVVSKRVMRMRVRFWDGRGWRESFDSAAEGRLPAAVEVAVWMAPLQYATGREALAARRRMAGLDAPEEAEAPEGHGVRRAGDRNRTGMGGDELAGNDLFADQAMDERRAQMDALAEQTIPWGEPTRLRVMVAADGPEAGWNATAPTGEGGGL